MIKPNKQVTKFYQEAVNMQSYLEELADKKQESFDNKSDTWQESDKGMEAQDDLDNLPDLITAVEEVVEHLDNVFNFS